MPKRFQAACVVAGPLAVLLAIVRCVALPQVVSTAGDGGLSTALLITTLVTLLGIGALSFGGDAPSGGIGGRPLWGMIAGALLVGGDMVASSVWALFRFLATGEMPVPTKVFTTVVDDLLLYALVITGILGGAFFLFVGVLWLKNRRTVRHLFRVMALVPVFWIWVRVLRFEVSVVSSLNLHRSAYELLMLLFEMVFLFWFARFLSGVEEKPARGLVAVALCTGVLTAIASITRLGMTVFQSEAIAETCSLTTAADMGLCVLAFAFAFGRVFAPTVETPPPMTVVPESLVMEQIMRELEKPDDPTDEEDDDILLRVDKLMEEE